MSVCRLGDEYRPVKLQRVVHGYPFQEGSSDFRFDISLNYKLYSIIENYSHGRPTLVVCFADILKPFCCPVFFYHSLIKFDLNNFYVMFLICGII